VADDEKCIRLLLERGLRLHGFDVTLAATGRQAVEQFQQDAGIAVVLLDVQMPELSGPETLAALRRIAPEVRCCFMTGDAGSHTEEGLLQLGAARVFFKPFVLGEVAQVLHRLADGPTSD
jgi:CheY-like chemotaxis protein